MAALLAIGTTAFIIHAALIGQIFDMTNQGMAEETKEFLWLVGTFFFGVAAVLFSVGLIGLFERLLPSPRRWVRWLADSSYWIYIIHLPLVAFLTFSLAHLDRQGWLKYLTGVSWGAETKFRAACVVTGIVGLASYRYLVRYTFIGALLNGKRTKALP